MSVVAAHRPGSPVCPNLVLPPEHSTGQASRTRRTPLGSSSIGSCRELDLDVIRDSTTSVPNPSDGPEPRRRFHSLGSLPRSRVPVQPPAQTPKTSPYPRHGLVGSMHALNHYGCPSPGQVPFVKFFWRCRFSRCGGQSVPQSSAGVVMIIWSVPPSPRMSNPQPGFFSVSGPAETVFPPPSSFSRVSGTEDAASPLLVWLRFFQVRSHRASRRGNLVPLP